MNHPLSEEQISQSVAIIGMAGRFPGADSISAFWKNLTSGICSLETLSDDELSKAGVPDEIIKSPQCIKRAGILHNTDLFDAPFFLYSAREAELIDPQQRLFLECAWEAFEDAGYTPESTNGPIGVFAGAGMNYYLIKNLLSQQKRFEDIVDFLTFIGNDKDYLCSRVSYKLGFTGPSLVVNSACSTSLAAVQVGYQYLLTGQCDLALCGGVSLQSPRDRASLYNEGEIFSADGYCRTFDKDANGMVFGEGLGLVLLKRTEEAMQDRDHIYAIIRSAAINNDGSTRAGFTAPGVESQADLITLTQALAGVHPDEIAFIEAHGTATKLGDAIEISALKKAFERQSERKRFCAIGSVKTNIGHLDTAAGVTSLIKTALSVQNKLLPASLHCTIENPDLSLENSPFFVAKEMVDFKNIGSPLIAGISSFGMGGTNVHAIVQEPFSRLKSEKTCSHYLVPLSARTNTALASARKRLKKYIEENKDINIQDIAYTLQTGRRAFFNRWHAVCTNMEELIVSLDSSTTMPSGTVISSSSRNVIFAFSGQGAQYPGMGRDLYLKESIVREVLDNAREIMRAETGEDLFIFLFPAEGCSSENAAQTLTRTIYTQPVLFAIEYALASLFVSFGITPAACIGHSIGEFTAAAFAGVFTFEQGMKIVIQRARIMDAMKPGSMAHVSLSENELMQHIYGNLVIALVNAPGSCVVAGPSCEINPFIENLKQKKIRCGLLQTSHAFHSPLMDEAAHQFREFLTAITFNKPTLPFISNVTGTWITDDQCTSKDYWAEHLRKTVRFSDGISELIKENFQLFVEIGPGNTLSTLIGMHETIKDPIVTIPSLRHYSSKIDDRAFFSDAIGNLWAAGMSINWLKFYSQESTPNRIPLPTYPFERKRYWIEPDTPITASNQTYQNNDTSDTCHTSKGHNSTRISDGERFSQSAMEHYLTDLWTKLLGVETISIDDNFFDLGGHSFLAVEIFNDINKKFNVRLSIAVLIKHNTIKSFAGLLSSLVDSQENRSSQIKTQTTVKPGIKDSLWNTVVPIQPSGNLPPFFCVSGFGGNPLELHFLGTIIGQDQPFYALQHRGVDGGNRPHDTIEKMAAEFLADIRAIQPAGPYYIGGYSFGGIAAYEMVQQLVKNGDTIGGLILLDTANPQLVKWTPAEYIRSHLVNIKKKGAGYIFNRGIAFLTSRVRRKLATTSKKDSFSLRNDLVKDYNIRATFSYKPLPIKTSTLLIQCALNIAPEGGIGFPRREANGWRTLIPSEKFEMQIIQTDHLEMIKMPFVSETARLINNGLETFRRNCTQNGTIT